MSVVSFFLFLRPSLCLTLFLFPLHSRCVYLCLHLGLCPCLCPCPNRANGAVGKALRLVCPRSWVRIRRPSLTRTPAFLFLPLAIRTRLSPSVTVTASASVSLLAFASARASAPPSLTPPSHPPSAPPPSPPRSPTSLLQNNVRSQTGGSRLDCGRAHARRARRLPSSSLPRRAGPGVLRCKA